MSKEDRDFLTREDLFQLELLADGELDEESRRDLLERLDRTDDGWRRCALAFLQAQCLGESLGDEISFAETESADESIGLYASAPPKRETSFWRKRSRRTVALISSACALLLAGLVGVRFFADRGSSPIPGAINAPHYAERSVSDTSFDSASNGAPLLASGEEPAESESEDVGMDAAAERRLADVDAGRGRSAGPEVASSGRMMKSGAIGVAPAGLSMVAGLAPGRGRAADPADSSKVRHITIRRPGGLDEISVPCVEADSYVPDHSAAESLAQNYREAGCQVETLHEELKFRLQNGKTVIVPVDTIDVQHAPNQTHFL